MGKIEEVSGGADDIKLAGSGVPAGVGGAQRSDVIDLTDEGMKSFDFGHYDSLPKAGPGLRMGRRGLLVAGSVVVVAAAVGASFLFAVSSPPLANLAAEVTNTGEISLGFPVSGVIASLPVKAGEMVSKGWPLATLTVPGAGGALVQSQAALVASESEERTLRNLLSDTSNQEEGAITAYVNQLTNSENDAKGALGSAKQEAASVATGYSSVVSQAQSSLSTAKSDESVDCRGVPAISGTPDASELACQNATVVVGQDQLSLAQAEATADNSAASYAAVVSQDTKELSDAQAALSEAKSTGLAGTLALQTQLAQIHAQIVEDQAAVQAAQGKVGVQTLTASASGRIVLVNGTVGEVTGQSGTVDTSPSGSQLDVAKGFNLFPSSQGVSQSTTGSVPLIVLKTSNQATVDTLVPQSQIGLVRIGDKARFTPSVSGLGVLRGNVVQVFPKPTVVNGTLNYEVQISVSHTRDNYLDGITGSVTITNNRQ